MGEIRYNWGNTLVSTSVYDEQITQDDLMLNIACYESKDENYIQDLMDIKYNSKGRIRVYYPRFFKSFIDSQSNIYINYFERIVDGDYKFIDIEELNSAMEWAEKYSHLSGKSLLYMKSTNEFQVFDASKYRKVSEDYFIVVNNSGNLHLKSDGVYIEDRIENETILTLISSTKVCPAIELVFSDYKKHEVVDLQYEWIADFSWGMHSVAPKLLTQLMVKSDNERDVVKQAMDGVGHSQKLIQMGMNDSVEVLLMGDLKNLESIIKIYNDAIKQQAMQNGVDINDVNLMSMFESGIAKIVEKNHINTYRKQFFRTLKKFEKELWFKISQLFNLKCEFVNIIFYPLQFLEVGITEYKESITLNSTEYATFKSQTTQLQNTNQTETSTEQLKEQIDSVS